MKRKPRGLKPDELEIWRRVTDATIPIHKPRIENPERPRKTVSLPPQNPQISQFYIGEKTPSTGKPFRKNHSISDHLRSLTPIMDRKTFTKMNKGKLKPDARIDLHGMTLAQAHPNLNRFIVNQHMKNARLVLVITGKGKNKPDESFFFEQKGVLRNQVPHWLSTPPLREIVLEVRPAHLRHGGDGAYYVYLRRR